MQLRCVCSRVCRFECVHVKWPCTMILITGSQVGKLNRNLAKEAKEELPLLYIYIMYIITRTFAVRIRFRAVFRAFIKAGIFVGVSGAGERASERERTRWGRCEIVEWWRRKTRRAMRLAQCNSSTTATRVGSSGMCMCMVAACNVQRRGGRSYEHM